MQTLPYILLSTSFSKTLHSSISTTIIWHNFLQSRLFKYFTFEIQERTTTHFMKKKHLKVLIVDDALLVTERISEIINGMECVKETVIATGYQQAVFLLKSFKPDVVLLDIHLPEKSGIELLEFVKKNYPVIKAVMLTNQTSDNYKIICRNLGSDHFVDKSSEFENIPSIIESYSGKTVQKL
jgi:CheY-like chemotaxis protein